MVNVFLSHKQDESNADLVHALYASLEGLGLRVFVAEYFRQPGTPVTVKVQEELDRSDVFIALLTKEGTDSAAVNQEVGYAVKAGKLVVPLIENGTKPTMFLYGLEGIHFDRFNPQPMINDAANFVKRIADDRKRLAIVALLIGVVLVALFALAMGASRKGKVTK